MPGATDFNRPGTFVTETLTPLTASVSSVTGQAIPVFAGAYNVGPTAPILVTSWQQYITQYGSFTTALASTNIYLHMAVNQYFGNGGSQCYVLRVANTDAVAGTLILKDIATPTANNILTVTMQWPGAYGNTIFIGVTSAGTTGRSTITVYQGGTGAGNAVETFPDLSMNPADKRNVTQVINSPATGSRFITVTPTFPGGVYVAGTNDLAVVTPPSALTGGTDGSTPPTLGSAVPNSLDTLQNTILNVNLPAINSSTTINSLITWAQGRGDVEIIVDGPAPSFPETSAQVVTNYTNMISTLTVSSYAALYAPWILIPDPSSSVPGTTRWVPPGGAVLGKWNNTDTVVGVQQTPAGVLYGNINAISLEATFNPTDLDNLNTANVNAIKAVPGSGFCIFGGRTLNQVYPDRYITVRRSLQKLEHDMINLTQFAVFLPNAQPLWDQITSVLTNYLTLQMQAGLFAGNTPTTAFTVTCDSTVNTPQQAQAGIVNAIVAVALLSPAEFIIINVQQLQVGTVNTAISG